MNEVLESQQVVSKLPDFKESDFEGNISSGTFNYWTSEGDQWGEDIPLWKITSYIEQYDMNADCIVINRSSDGNPAHDVEKWGHIPVLKYLRDNIEMVSRLYFQDNLQP